MGAGVAPSLRNAFPAEQASVGDEGKIIPIRFLYFHTVIATTDIDCSLIRVVGEAIQILPAPCVESVEAAGEFVPPIFLSN